MAEFLMKPKIDFAFKEIMMDENARIGFLASVLQLDPEDIKETRILNPYLRKTHEDDKLGILDVRILMNDDTVIDVEIQLSELSVWPDRSLFYAAKMYAEQIEPGQKYDVLKNASASASWILRFSKKRRTSIPASTSGRTPEAFCTPTRWSSM